MKQSTRKKLQDLINGKKQDVEQISVYIVNSETGERRLYAQWPPDEFVSDKENLLNSPQKQTKI